MPVYAETGLLMAHIKSIWVMGGAGAVKNQLKVNVLLKPDGQVNLVVDIPEDFYDAITKMAQIAADLHEQKMRAQILADKEK